MLIGKKTVTGAITLMLLFTIGCSDDRQSQETVQPVKVVAGKLTERTFQRRLRVQGVVQPIDEAEIASRTTGTLDILAVDEGDCVKVGQTLFQDPADPGHQRLIGVGLRIQKQRRMPDQLTDSLIIKVPVFPVCNLLCDHDRLKQHGADGIDIRPVIRPSSHNLRRTIAVRPGNSHA